MKLRKITVEFFQKKNEYWIRLTLSDGNRKNDIVIDTECDANQIVYELEDESIDKNVIN